MPSDRPIIQRRRAAASRPAPKNPETTQDLLDLPLGDDSATPGPDLPTEPPASPRAHEPLPAPARRSRSRGRSPWKSLVVLTFAVVAAVPLGIAIGYSLKPTPPVPVLSTDLVSFGEVPVGRSARAEVRLQNDGEADLEVGPWSVIGGPSPSATPFSVVDDGGCRDVRLPRDAACKVVIQFKPSTAGSTQARLKVTMGSGPDTESRTLPILGSGVAPALDAEPTELRFGEATVGYRGGRQTLSLINRGSAELKISTVGLQGLGAADFIPYVDRCSGATLAPGSRCDVGFELVPTIDGERRATLRISSDAAPMSDPPQLVGFGKAQIPVLSVQPQRLDFGKVRLGRRTEPRRVVISNSGNGPLQIRTLQIAAPAGSDRRDLLKLRESDVVAGFPLRDVDCEGRNLDPGQSCSFLVLFEPRLEDPVGALALIEHSAAASAHRLPIVGTGTAPRLQVSPAQLSFGEVVVGQAGPWQSLELKNIGTAELKVESIKKRGADHRFFEVSSDGCTRAPIPPGQSCAAEIRFRARRNGPHRANLTVRHDGEDGRRTLALNGLGTSARLAIRPTSIDFGTVGVHRQALRNLELRNTGRAPLTVLDVALSGQIAQVGSLSGDCRGRTLRPRESCEVEIRFAPNRAGTWSGAVKIRRDGVGRAFEVDLRGTAVGNPG